MQFAHSTSLRLIRISERNENFNRNTPNKLDSSTNNKKIYVVILFHNIRDIVMASRAAYPRVNVREPKFRAIKKKVYEYKDEFNLFGIIVNERFLPCTDE